MKHYYFLFLSFCLVLSSCSKDDSSTVTDYTQGTFIVNQGTFGNGTGTITYVKDDLVIQHVFEKENSGNVLGNVVQSMVKFDNKYFIAVNNGAAIQVVDARTFKSLGSITGIDLPRYFAVVGNKLYVSAWNNDFATGKVFQINASTLTFSAVIEVNGTPEKMMAVGDQIYVTLATIGDKSNRIITINTQKNTITKTIIVGDNPHSLALDKNGDIWVSCSGNADFVDPSKSTDGSLYRLKNDVAEQIFKLKADTKDLEINQAGDKLYLISDVKVVSHMIGDLTFTNESIYEGLVNAIGLDPSTDRLYVAKGDFVSSGKAIEINLTTKALKEIATGIGPGFFYFSN